ncbi:MAG: TonB-dependent receptor [Chitinophagaceae bacterium]|jgi:TonB-linked SusC/RagA family outer membrane protein|nr:TonB-dependent receptor [Chitinophagaceae bacterium]
MGKKIILIGGLLMFLCQLHAQIRTITGKVTDEQGNPVSNASVTIRGGGGTNTDENGVFNLRASASAKTLVVSSLNFVTQEIEIGNNTNFTVVLKSTTSQMDEVVVIGYGTQRRADVVSNISTIKGSAIAEKPTQSFDQSLAGRAAGVQITIPNGVLNNPPVFRIRGTNSISLSSYPLIVIDGVPTFTGDQSGSYAAYNPLSSVNPSDIESVDILKDAAATAIYGSRAANGVVVVTTKKGRKGNTKVAYDGWVGWNSPTRLWKMLDANQYMTLKNEARENMGQADAFFPTNDAAGKEINTNWENYLYKTGLSHAHTVNLSGANETTNYYLSAGYTDQQGILVTNKYNRKNIRFNVDHKISNYVSIGANANYSNELNASAINTGSVGSGVNASAFSSAGFGRLALILPPNISPYNNDGSYNVSGSNIGQMNNTVAISFSNPAVIIDNQTSSTESNHIQGNLYLQVKPIQDITLRTQYGIDYLTTVDDIFWTPLPGNVDGYGANGEAASASDKYSRWVWTNTAQYDHTFALKHNLNFLVGTEQQYTQTSGFGLDRKDIADPFYTVIQGSFSLDAATNTNGNLGQNYMVSGFGRLNYNFDKRYYIGGSVRRDGYSAFAPGKKYGNFWSVSGAWNISSEKFWVNSSLRDVINDLRIRGSYGTVGNISGIADFASYSLYSLTGLYNGSTGMRFSQAGNPDLTWETSKKTDIGIQFGLLKGIITGDIAWYKNNIDGLIINVPQAGSTGVPTLTIPTNVGTMYNQGWEINLNATPIRKKDFSWTTSFNITFNKNKVTSLAEGVPNIKSVTGLETANITLPDYPAGMIYVIPTAGVDPATGNRIFVNAAGDQIRYDYRENRYHYMKDGTIAPNINPAADQIPYAQSNPKYFGGFDNTFRYKGFDLNFLFTFQGGNHIYNGTQASVRDQRFWNNTTDMLRRWQNPGDITDIPKVYYGDNISNGSANPISANVQKGDFLKMKMLTLGYTFPALLMNKAGITNARIYAGAQNLFVITQYKGSDPEVSTNASSPIGQGVERNIVANGRVITVGLNVGF